LSEEDIARMRAGTDSYVQRAQQFKTSSSALPERSSKGNDERHAAKIPGRQRARSRRAGRISDTWRQVQARRDYPVAVRTLLGEMLAASALLSANLKFNGMIVMQIHGDGPVKLLVVECDSELKLRATAKLADDAEIADDATLTDLVNANGKAASSSPSTPRTSCPASRPTRAWSRWTARAWPPSSRITCCVQNSSTPSCGWPPTRRSRAACCCRSCLPSAAMQPRRQAGGELEDWNHMVMLGDTLKREELLSTDIATLMHRLFWEQTIRVFDPVHPQFHCSCSREKVGNMLKMLGQEEVAEALSQMEKLAIDCDFCGSITSSMRSIAHNCSWPMWVVRARRVTRGIERARVGGAEEFQENRRKQGSGKNRQRYFKWPGL
jgi:molecular chaperone Hsp33